LGDATYLLRPFVTSDRRLSEYNRQIRSGYDNNICLGRHPLYERLTGTPIYARHKDVQSIIHFTGAVDEDPVTRDWFITHHNATSISFEKSISGIGGKPTPGIA
jgi:hypothetical protein